MDGILKEYKTIDRRIDFLLAEQSAWKKKGDISTSHETLKKVSVIEREINSKIDQLVVVKKRIEEMIEGIGDARQREILRYLYIAGMTAEQAAETTNYSIQHVFKIKKKALEGLSLSAMGKVKGKQVGSAHP